MEKIIKVKNLSKKFGEFQAVGGISFEVNEGEIFGLLGPNGAGKTTTIKMLTTLLQPTGGEVDIAGLDIRSDPKDVRKIIGIIFQDPSLDEELTGRENLEFHAILYKIDKEKRTERISEILKLIELEDKADILVKNYSGGMKRRLEIGRGLIHQPKVLFLDEPTLGLDVQTRRHIWDYIKKLNETHKVTIILTTHYIEEADFLTNRVAFIDHGKIVALDTPTALKNKLGGDVVSIKSPGNAAALETIFKKTKWVRRITKHEDFIDLTLVEAEKKVPEIINIATKNRIKIESVNIHKPSLEDVFIYYTGKTIREEAGEGWKGMMRSVRMKRNR